MKVFVIVSFLPFGPEIYWGCAKSKKDAEKKLRKKYPFLCEDPVNDCYLADKKSTFRLRVFEEEVK